MSFKEEDESSDLDGLDITSRPDIKNEAAVVPPYGDLRPMETCQSGDASRRVDSHGRSVRRWLCSREKLVPGVLLDCLSTVELTAPNVDKVGCELT